MKPRFRDHTKDFEIVPEKKKLRPCLRCDVMTMTTTSYRLCEPCRKHAINTSTGEPASDKWEGDAD